MDGTFLKLRQKQLDKEASVKKVKEDRERHNRHVLLMLGLGGSKVIPFSKEADVIYLYGDSECI